MTVDANKNVTSATVTIVDMADVEPSQALRDLPLIQEAHQATIDFIQGGSGENGQGGVSLGSTTARFQPDNEIAGIPAGKLQDTAVMDLINQIQLEQSGADVSAAALFKDTSDLPEGDINYGNIFDIYKFDNTLYRVTVTGAELKAYMEWSAECYNQWVPGDVSISFDPEYPGYLYDMFAGVDYEIDLSKPKGERIQNVMFQGQPLADDQLLTLAVNNYRYSSALKSQGLVEGKRDWESSNSIRDMIVAYFAEHSPVEPKVDNNWRITGVDLQLDSPDRAALIALVNNGQLNAPYDASLNLDACAKVLDFVDNVKVTDLDKTGAAASFVGRDGQPYFRLRDLAFVFSGSKNQFNVGWDGQVTVTTGAPYDGEVLTLPMDLPSAGTRQAPVEISVSVNGSAKTVPAIAVDGHYYLTAEAMNTLLGTNATVQEKD